MGAPSDRQPDPRIAAFEAEADEALGSVATRRAARVRRIAASVAVVGAALVLALLILGPVAKSVARSRASELGLAVDVQRASIGFGVVRFYGVSVSAPELTGVSVTLDRVDVRPGFGIRSPSLEVHGGRVKMRGSVDDIERQVSAFQSRRKAGPPGKSERATPISAAGIDVAWQRGRDSTALDCAWGVRYDRTADGRESLSADLVQAALANLDVRMSRGHAEFRREHGQRFLTNVSTERICGTLRLDATPDESLPATPSDAPPSRARPTAKPAPEPAVGGPREKAVSADDDHARGERWLVEVRRFVRSAAEALVPPARVSLSGASIAVLQGDQRLNIGPASVTLDRETDRLKLGFVPTARDTTAPVRFEATMPIDKGPIDVDLVGGPVSLAALGVKERDMGLLEVDRAEVEIAGHAEWSEDGRFLSFSGRSRASDLALFQEKLAPDPVRNVALSLEGAGNVAVDGSRVELGKVDLLFGKIRLETRGILERGDGFARGSLHVAVPLAACSDVLASTPAALIPLLKGVEASGTLAFAGDLEFDTRRPGDTRVAWNAANECRITRVPESLSPDRFKHPWARTVLGADDMPMTIETGPGTDTWVPLQDISPFLPTGIVVCEDSRFFQHEGFDAKAIQDSIRNNLRAGRFVRGASTVSMQLAKNLYLGREKTLSRKLQEAVLTLLLEQTLTKEQILELYLNVIEFAPGVYGVGPAASYYFRSMPKDLSLGQSLYLASILSNPKNRHFSLDGTLSDAWSEYLRKLMVIAHKIRRLDDHELALGLAETVRFGVAADPGRAPLREGDDATEIAPPEDGYPSADGP